MERFFKGLFNFFLDPLPQDPYSVGCQASDVQKHASFFTSSPFWYRQKRLLWNSLSACSLAWTSLMSDCSLFLAWTQRSGDGFARQMRLSVCEGVKWHKKAVSASQGDGESQHYTHVKSIKNKSAHEENTEFMVKELHFFPLQSNKKLFHIQPIVLHKEIVITFTFRGFRNVVILQHNGSLYFF